MKKNYQHSCRHCRPRHTRSHHYIDTANPSVIEKLAEGVWMFVVYMLPAAIVYGLFLSLIAPQ